MSGVTETRPSAPVSATDCRDEDPLTVEQVAQILRISTEEVETLATRKQIPGAHLEHGRWIVDPITFRRWVSFLLAGALRPAPRAM